MYVSKSSSATNALCLSHHWATKGYIKCGTTGALLWHGPVWWCLYNFEWLFILKPYDTTKLDDADHELTYQNPFTTALCNLSVMKSWGHLWWIQKISGDLGNMTVGMYFLNCLVKGFKQWLSGRALVYYEWDAGFNPYYFKWMNEWMTWMNEWVSEWNPCETLGFFISLRPNKHVHMNSSPFTLRRIPKGTDRFLKTIFYCRWWMAENNLYHCNALE